jgi:quinol monooxygenase YgiN
MSGGLSVAAKASAHYLLAHASSDSSRAIIVAEGKASMHGLIGKIKATPGQRDALVRILLEGIEGMPGCLSYVVARDPSDGDAIWITEVWDSAESHKASLSLPSVQGAIAKGRPLIAGFEQHIATEPVGGHGLPT